MLDNDPMMEEFDALSAIMEDTGQDILGTKLMDRFFTLSAKLFPILAGVGSLGRGGVLYGGGGGGYVGGPIPIFTGGVGVSSMSSHLGCGGGAGGSIGIAGGAGGCGGGGSYSIGSGIVTLPVAVNPGVAVSISVASVTAAVPNIYLTSDNTWHLKND